MLNIHLFGYEKYKGTKCAVGEFEFDNGDLITKLWIDAKKGTYLKITNTGISPNGEQYEFEDEYEATYNIVKDEDVERPDLTGYEKIENNIYTD